MKKRVKRFLDVFLLLIPFIMFFPNFTIADNPCNVVVHGVRAHDESWTYSYSRFFINDGDPNKQVTSTRIQSIDQLILEQCILGAGDKTGTITKTLTKGISGSVSSTGHISFTKKLSTELGVGALAKVSGTTGITAGLSIEVGSTFSTQEQTSVSCEVKVKECFKLVEEMKQTIETVRIEQKVEERRRTIAKNTSGETVLDFSIPCNRGTLIFEAEDRLSITCATVSCQWCCPPPDEGGEGSEQLPGDNGDKQDSDKDGIPDDTETEQGTDPYDKDSDDDGLNDPTDPCPTNSDCDSDGVSDYVEWIDLGTDVFIADTDEDMIDDCYDPFPLDPYNPTLLLESTYPPDSSLIAGPYIDFSFTLSHLPPPVQVVINDTMTTFVSICNIPNATVMNIPLEEGVNTIKLKTIPNTPCTESIYIGSISLTVDPECCVVAGDANSDGDTNVGDAVFVINYVFKSGYEPLCPSQADTNNDCGVNIGDAVYLINFVFKGGSSPVCGCATH